MGPYTEGVRIGSGEALAIARPGSLLEIWEVLGLCTQAQVAIIMQASNTGLTGGSTPSGSNYDRPIVIINTLRINKIHLINDAKQIIALPGSTLYELEDKLEEFGREPHSVIGSSCIGASIIGGICNNSGGALVQRGPAYTELALFARIGSDGLLSLVNNLDIYLGDTPEEILTNLELKKYTEKDIKTSNRLASGNEYDQVVRDISADTPSRYNNNSNCLHEASGCAGKLVVFAVRLDTFPKAVKKRVFYIGTNNPDVMTKIRLDILSNFKNLPISGEYFDQDCYDISKKYGKDIFLIVNKLGSKFIPQLFAFKRWVDRIAKYFPFLSNNFSDHIMQILSHYWPNHLPKRLENFRQRYKFHFILETSGDGVDEAQNFFDNFFDNFEGSFFVCNDEESKKAILHRFVIGGAINRYYLVNGFKNGAMAPIDVALRRNDDKWSEAIPIEVGDKIFRQFSYGHFLCHVFHRIYIIKNNFNVIEVKNQILDFLDERGAEYPAEHNVGHEYAAKPDLKEFYKECDPTNTFNPGIGKTSKYKDWT